MFVSKSFLESANCPSVCMSVCLPACGSVCRYCRRGRCSPSASRLSLSCTPRTTIWLTPSLRNTRTTSRDSSCHPTNQAPTGLLVYPYSQLCCRYVACLLASVFACLLCLPCLYLPVRALNGVYIYIYASFFFFQVQHWRERLHGASHAAGGASTQASVGKAGGRLEGDEGRHCGYQDAAREIPTNMERVSSFFFFLGGRGYR